MGHGLNTAVSTAAVLVFTITPTTHAADNSAHILNTPASHVASVDSSLALQTEMESLIPEALKPRFYLPLSSGSKQIITFFYQGFKEKVDDKTELSALLGKAVALLFARETNNKSAEEMKLSIQESEKTGKDAKLSRIAPIYSPISTISAIFPSSDNSPYSQAFAALQQEMEAKHAEAKALQDVIMSKDPEAVVIAKRNLEASQKEREASRAELALAKQEAALAKQEAARTTQIRQQTTQIRHILEGKR